MSSPTQLTLKKWREAGYNAAVVERWNPHSKTRQDLFGFVDVLCVGHGTTVAIQTTSYGNVSARVRKIEDMPEIVGSIRDAGWRVIVEGWHQPKGKGTRWKCREVDIS